MSDDAEDTSTSVAVPTWEQEQKKALAVKLRNKIGWKVLGWGLALPWFHSVLMLFLPDYSLAVWSNTLLLGAFWLVELVRFGAHWTED